MWSLSQLGQLVWTNTVFGTVTVIQRTTNLDAPTWEPFWYDTADPGLHTNWLPAAVPSSSFYRLDVETNVPDPSLVLYLPFDNDWTNTGTILDASGYGNNALRYSLTNWPSPAVGPDGSVAAKFVRNGSSVFEGDGDYAGIPWTTNAPFYRLTNGTLLAWAHYDTNSYHVSTIIDGSSYSLFPYSWSLGRSYSQNTRFNVVGTNGTTFLAVVYPDSTSTGDTGGWHYYGVTWDGTNFIGYFDGVPISTNSQAGFPALVLGGKPSAHWIAIGCLTHNGTPQIDGDGYPNNGMFGGEIDDIRIYNRALSGAEIQTLYNRMHKF